MKGSVMRTQVAKKRFMAGHAKSSAMLVSVIVHSVLLVFAGTWVAVRVTTRPEWKPVASVFEIANPRTLPLKKLFPDKASSKMPVMRPMQQQRIVVKDVVVPSDFTIPEIESIISSSPFLGDSTGITGVDIVMPTFKFVGLPGQGEKIFIILDSSPEMMYDEVGGMEAYELIKKEIGRLIQELPPTTLFNVCVYEHGDCRTLFPNLVQADNQNAGKVAEWLGPLNAVREGMGSRDYGLRTLGKGGVSVDEPLLVGGKSNIEGLGLWSTPVAIAMKQQADSIYLLTARWGEQRKEIRKATGWSEAKEKRWQEAYQKGLKLLDEENKARLAAGKPPRVLRRDSWAINGHYFPGVESPPSAEWYNYSPKDFQQEFLAIRRKHAEQQPALSSGLDIQKDRFSFNVINFVQANGETVCSWDQTEDNFKRLVGLCSGRFQKLAGLKAVQSSVASR
jgi:hypothetical protein